jgi:hypothetical protein
VFAQERVLQLETQLRQRDGEIQEALAAASAAGGRDKQVRMERCTGLVGCKAVQHSTVTYSTVQYSKARQARSAKIILC